MPVIEIHVLEGYSPEAKVRLGQGVTRAVRQVIPATPEAVTVMIRDIPSDNYLRGGTARQGAPALPDPAETVRAFLAAMEARDLARAQSFLAEGFEMRFPGTGPMHSLPELVAWAAPRYRFVRKTYAAFDVAAGEDGPIVHCHGTLHGEWPDGTPFEGIRFIDRFELRDGKLARQDVWNDIAETKAQAEARG